MIGRTATYLLVSCIVGIGFASSFNPNIINSSSSSLSTCLLRRSTTLSLKSAMSSTVGKDKDEKQLYDPTVRDATYGSNVAQYLVDLHDSKATFNFCGGMMFQLILSDKLRDHLGNVASQQENQKEQPVVFDKLLRMNQIPGYEKSAKADNVRTFHGREVRNVKDAAGGMGFAIHLSMANSDDPEGWTSNEINDYDGWGHDINRTWRNGERLQQEGFSTYKQKFGNEAFGLHHKFYLHTDANNRIWLAAEDGCEGTPAAQKPGFRWPF